MKPADDAAWRGVVLAGGRSTRMGRDKASLPWAGRTLLDHMCHLLREAGAEEVVVSGDRPAHGGIPDASPDGGPVSALAQMAPQLCDGAWIVVPVDMPLLTRGLLADLRAPSVHCACFQGHALPMCLRLDTHSRAIVAQVGAQTGPACSFRRLQQALDAHHLRAAPWGDAFRNCNTPEEWRRMLPPHSDSSVDFR